MACVSSGATDLDESSYWDFDARRLRHDAGGMVAGIEGGFYRPDPERRTARLIAAAELEAAPRAQPLARHVFAIRGVGTGGIPEPRFCE